jgi:hypothetical protein
MLCSPLRHVIVVNYTKNTVMVAHHSRVLRGTTGTRSAVHTVTESRANTEGDLLTLVMHNIFNREYSQKFYGYKMMRWRVS